jgi:DNA-binding protein HU-beta
MTYEELVTNLSENHELPKATMKGIVDDLVGLIKTNAKMGVRIPSLGTFKLVHKDARTCRNPATGEPVAVAAKDVLKFKASKS